MRNNLAAKVAKASKELGRDLGAMARKDGEDGGAAAGDALAYAVYDQDGRSRANQMVKKIDECSGLDEAEREALLAGQQQGVADIEKLLDADQKKQEQDLDAALKAKLERRRKRQAGRGKAQLKQEERAAEASIKAQIDVALADKVRTAEQEAQDELREAKAGAQSGNPIAKAVLTKLREALAA